MLTGLYIVGLVQHQQKERALQLLSELNAANAQGREGRQWDFAEYHHGLTHAPMGTHFQAWSAAAGVLAHQAVWHNEIPWPSGYCKNSQGVGAQWSGRNKPVCPNRVPK